MNEVKFKISAINNASSTLEDVRGDLSEVTNVAKESQKSLSDWAEENRATFTKMAAVWTVATTWIVMWVNRATQAAAQDEWTWNKFSTVFADGTDEMNDFVDDLRTRMPVATGTIQRMAADMQDLLVPIGLSRELGAEMTQGFLETANAIWAFNDVNPAEVLEAIKSWATWIATPLKRFWVDASVTALEARALEMWLLDTWETFAKLAPEVANQIRVQALLEQVMDQSSDAVNWFEQNADSLIFRQMEMKATAEDLSGIYWAWFIPIVDSIVQKIIPLLRSLWEWVTENQELATMATIVVWSLTALIAAAWLLWLALPSIIAGFAAMKITLLALTWPVWLVIWAIAWIIWIVILVKSAVEDNFLWIQDAMNSFWAFIFETIPAGLQSIKDWFINAWNSIKETTSLVFGAIGEAIWSFFWFLAWLFEARFQLLVSIVAWFFYLLTWAWTQALETLKSGFVGMWDYLKLYLDGILEAIKTAISWAWTIIKNMFSVAIEFLKNLWTNWMEFISNGATDMVNGVINLFTNFKPMVQEAFWNMMWGITDTAKSIFDWIISTIQGFINRVVDSINWLIKKANAVPGVNMHPIGRVNWGWLAHGWVAWEGTYGWEAQSFSQGWPVFGQNWLDNVPAMLSAWEVVLNHAQQRTLAANLIGRKEGQSITLNFAWANVYGVEWFMEEFWDGLVKVLKNHIPLNWF